MKKFAAIAAATIAAISFTARPAAAADIVDTAIGAPQFSTLVSLIKKAGLVETLKGTGPFTVFAPTNAAFAKLPKATVAKLLTPAGKAQLVKILTYHVVPGNLTSAAVVKMGGGSPKTVQGGMVMVKVKPSVMVNNAKVVKADIKADNGVIHAIDTVLMPGMNMGKMGGSKMMMDDKMMPAPKM